MIIVVFGLPGSGKSYFAHHLSDLIGAIHLNSDRVRKRLAKKGSYDKQAKQQVYKALIDEAGEKVKEGKPVIVDATFHKAENRQMVIEKANEFQESLFFIYLEADERVIYERVSQERPDSEADFRVYQILKAEMDPIEEPYLVLDSSNENLEPMLKKAQNYLGLETADN